MTKDTVDDEDDAEAEEEVGHRFDFINKLIHNNIFDLSFF